jgi:hypothetical protein
MRLSCDEPFANAIVAVERSCPVARSPQPRIVAGCCVQRREGANRALTGIKISREIDPAIGLRLAVTTP